MEEDRDAKRKRLLEKSLHISPIEMGALLGLSYSMGAYDGVGLHAHPDAQRMYDMQMDGLIKAGLRDEDVDALTSSITTVLDVVVKDPMVKKRIVKDKGGH